MNRTLIIQVARLASVGLVAAAAGSCTTSTEGGTGKPVATVLTAASVPGCPLGVEGALVTASDTDVGVDLTFLAPPARVEEIRTRARHAAAMHGNGAHEGLGHGGAHSQGGQHGLQPMQLPPAYATVEDVEGGARLTLTPVAKEERAALTEKAHDAAHRMNTAPCR